jgi:hypothetical protein
MEECMWVLFLTVVVNHFCPSYKGKYLNDLRYIQMVGEAMMDSFLTDMIITESSTQRMSLYEARVMSIESKHSGALQRGEWISLMASLKRHFISTWKNVNLDIITKIIVMLKW